jgi:high-affinity iron transporter
LITAMLILIREGFEITLVIAVIYTYLQRTNRLVLLRPMWQGVIAASVLSVLMGLVIHLTVDALVGDTKLRVSAAIAIVAAGVLTWLILLMGSHSRSVTDALEESIDHALATGRNVRLAVAGAAFLAVLREMLEASLFLIAASTTDSGLRILTGAAIGLVIAVVLGYAVVLGGRRLPLTRFFQVTGLVLIVFAAGLLARSVMYLQAAGDLPSPSAPVFDLTRYGWLTEDTEVGRFLTAMLGWDPQPSFGQVAVYFGYLAAAMALLRSRQVEPAEADQAAKGGDIAADRRIAVPGGAGTSRGGRGDRPRRAD